MTFFCNIFQVSPVVKGQSKEGKWWTRQEIKLNDRSVPVEKYISLMLWDCVQHEYASTWEPCKTGKDNNTANAHKNIVFIFSSLLFSVVLIIRQSVPG
jgi:hypothetical protein